jgi:hypothetical protein
VFPTMLLKMPARVGRTDDRRRSPRFRCIGQANITLLPSDGVFLPGTIRDLSLGGCHLDTTSPIGYGVRAEIVAHVNDGSFRAVGEVKGIRGESGVCLEFVQLSSAGKDMLADLLEELARLQALMQKLKSERLKMDEESFRRETDKWRFQAAELSERFPFLGKVLQEDNSGIARSEDTAEGSAIEIGRVIPVDLFG